MYQALLDHYCREKLDSGHVFVSENPAKFDFFFCDLLFSV